MGIRYCMHCGLPVSRSAKICPECGNALKMPVPKRKTQRSKQTSKRSAPYFAAGLIAVFCAAAFFVLNVGERIKSARSRHQENMMDAQRIQTTVRPGIRIPELRMPEISVPDIQLPKPPAAEFAVESYTVETNLSGETVLYVNISYTNKAEKEECFLTNFNISVQQENAACKKTAGDPARDNHLMKYVQPDETALVSEAFLISTEKETTVSLAAFFGKESYLEEKIIPHADGTVSVSE